MCVSLVHMQISTFRFYIIVMHDSSQLQFYKVCANQETASLLIYYGHCKLLQINQAWDKSSSLIPRIILINVVLLLSNNESWARPTDARDKATIYALIIVHLDVC